MNIGLLFYRSEECFSFTFLLEENKFGKSIKHFLIEKFIIFKSSIDRPGMDGFRFECVLFKNPPGRIVWGLNILASGHSTVDLQTRRMYPPLAHDAYIVGTSKHSPICHSPPGKSFPIILYNLICLFCSSHIVTLDYIYFDSFIRIFYMLLYTD